ncbi:MAG: Flp pilus assembly complex ATPase component TadA, partial [Anaerolineae bacterium]|nr:Flp pilus assembly complex ATPase component TadA [Anaerolineae bacterium]
LFDAAYRNLFTFGPLDALLADEAITELTIDGFASIHVRHRMGRPEPVQSYFEDGGHLARIVGRILTGGGAQLREDEPFVEVGLTLLGRPARLTLIGPPLSPVLHLDLRLHPAEATTFDGLRQGGAISEVDAAVLTALLASSHGLLIAGDVAAGKTTLLEALLPHVPDPASAWLVARADEVRAPEAMPMHCVVPVTDAQPGVDFATQIATALEHAPATLIADELRGDEAGPILAALAETDGPRCVFVLRASPEPARLRSAFGILLRKGQPDVPQAWINDVLLERLPFVVITRIDPAGLRVTGIGEWAAEAEGELTTLRWLVRDGVLSGARPRHALPGLDETFWTG